MDKLSLVMVQFAGSFKEVTGKVLNFSLNADCQKKCL